MLVQILILFFTYLLLPLFLIRALWRGRERSRFTWLLKALYTGAFVLYLFLAGSWDWFSVYLRWGYLTLFLAAAMLSYRRARGLPFFNQTGWRRLGAAWGELFTLAVFLTFLLLALRGLFYSAEPVRLAAPLRDGWYYVGQGGNSTLLNYHNSHFSQKYALDIVALNTAGFRARGFYPADAGSYVIFGHTVYAPCEGEVHAAVDGLPDLTPPETDRENVAGNHVVIACRGAEVVLAHLQNGSLLVQAGESVAEGQPIGRTGNSGNTSEPHLHIHAVREGTGGVLKGEGIPILINGRFLVRNSTFP